MKPGSELNMQVANKMSISFCSTMLTETLKQTNRSTSPSTSFPANENYRVNTSSFATRIYWCCSDCLLSSAATAMNAAFDLKTFLTLTFLPTNLLFLIKWRKSSSVSKHSLPSSSIWEEASIWHPKFNDSSVHEPVLSTVKIKHLLRDLQLASSLVQVLSRTCNHGLPDKYFSAMACNTRNFFPLLLFSCRSDLYHQNYAKLE